LFDVGQGDLEPGHRGDSVGADSPDIPILDPANWIIHDRAEYSLLHHNRHLYRFETRPAGTTVAFTKKYQVGATKEGVAFADVPKGPECIVSGGLGTMKVLYKGKEYYVCCSGCRDEFRENPEKYIKEAEAKAKK
jgi:hypothetical protein